MARGKAISVKIATVKVIKALEVALDKLNKDYSSQATNSTKFDKAVKVWQKEVGKLAVAHLAKAENISVNERYNGELNIDFNLPKGTIEVPTRPERDFDTMHEWQYKERREELENAIRILKMTDEEVVNTSTYNAVARYL